MRVLFLGDISGRTGRAAVTKFLPRLRQELSPDFVIANGENAAGGLGITRDTAREIFDAGVQCMTLGNHTWSKREALEMVDEDPRILRPANYPPGTPGAGWRVFSVGNAKLGVMNLLGRIFMEPLDSPFQVGYTGIEALRAETPCILIDFHAEATSEKQAFAWYADSRVSAVLGTHTHVQTADERILPGGTALLTDVGMVGPEISILGVEVPKVIDWMVSQVSMRVEIAPGPRVVISAALVDIDEATGHARSIQRILRYESL